MSFNVLTATLRTLRRYVEALTTTSWDDLDRIWVVDGDAELIREEIPEHVFNEIGE